MKNQIYPRLLLSSRERRITTRQSGGCREGADFNNFVAVVSWTKKVVEIEWDETMTLHMNNSSSVLPHNKTLNSSTTNIFPRDIAYIFCPHVKSRNALEASSSSTFALHFLEKASPPPPSSWHIVDLVSTSFFSPSISIYHVNTYC